MKVVAHKVKGWARGREGGVSPGGGQMYLGFHPSRTSTAVTVGGDIPVLQDSVVFVEGKRRSVVLQVQVL